jgi:hypothetical protein
MRTANQSIMNPLRKSLIPRLRAPIFLLSTLSLLAVLPLSAAQVNIFGTGVNGSNVVLAGGAQDTHWTITATTQPSPPNSNTFEAQGCTTFSDCGPAPANFPLNGTWASTAGGVSLGPNGWISPFTSDTNSSPIAGYSYSYTETFDLTAFTLGSVVLSGNWAADNCANIVLNGTQLTANDCTLPANGGMYNPKTAYVITNASGTGFVQGINTITWVVKNYASAGPPDPTGLLVEVTSATGNLSGAPEPATLFGVGLGLGVVGLAYRRRRRS